MTNARSACIRDWAARPACATEHVNTLQLLPTHQTRGDEQFHGDKPVFYTLYVHHYYAYLHTV